MQRIEIVPFGGLKPFFESGCFLEVKAALTVEDVKAQLSETKLFRSTLPSAGLALLEASAVSTETEIIPAGSPIPKDAKILFLLPPVSGG